MMWPDNCDRLEIPCTNFYSTYQNWCSEKGENKTLSDNKFDMEIKQFAPKTRLRRSGTRENCYILDKAKIAKNFSRVIQDIQDVQEALVGQKEVELIVEKPAPVEEKSAPVEENLAPVIEVQPVPKKTPPPVPPKPDSLKVKPAPVIKKDSVPEEPPAPVEEQDEPIDSFSDCYLSDEESDQEDTPPTEEPAPEAADDYDVLDDLLSDSAPEQQPESPVSPVSVAKSDSEPAPEEQPIPIPEEQPIPEPDTESEIDRDPKPKQGTKAHWAWYERHRWDRKP